MNRFHWDLNGDMLTFAFSFTVLDVEGLVVSVVTLHVSNIQYK